MFSNLGDFSIKRTAKEALGFYIAYLAITIVGAMAAGLIIGAITGRSDDFNFGVMIGQIVAIILALAISMTLLIKKNLLNGNNVFLILLALSSGILAYLGGGILGLIPAAYLSTR